MTTRTDDRPRIWFNTHDRARIQAASRCSHSTINRYLRGARVTEASVWRIEQADQAPRMKVRAVVKKHVSPIDPWDAALRKARASEAQAARSAGDEAWRAQLSFSGGGDVESTTANAALVLAYHQDWEGVLAFDEL